MDTGQVKEGECIQGILLSPADRGSIFVGKLAGNLVFLWIVEAVSLPVFGVLYDFPLDRLFLVLGPVVILATIGLATVGTLFASIAVNTKAREVMLPLLLFPVAIPIVIGAAGATTSRRYASALAPFGRASFARTPARWCALTMANVRDAPHWLG